MNSLQKYLGTFLAFILHRQGILILTNFYKDVGYRNIPRLVFWSSTHSCHHILEICKHVTRQPASFPFLSRSPPLRTRPFPHKHSLNPQSTRFVPYKLSLPTSPRQRGCCRLLCGYRTLSSSFRPSSKPPTKAGDSTPSIRGWSSAWRCFPPPVTRSF